METPRESIFVSALRSFCRTLFVMLGFFVALFAALILFSAFSGSYRPPIKTTLEILPDLEERRQLANLSAPVILRINIHGVIGDMGLKKGSQVTSEEIQNILLDSREGVLQRGRVKGILLHFDTPGGGVTDSDNIYRMLMKYKQLYQLPIFGYVDGMCASGGMYIASSTDRLFCGPTGIVGSVGVRSGPFFNLFDAMTNIGVQSKTITEGADKDMMNPFRPWKVNEDQNLKDVMAYFYQQFVDLVTSARPRLDKQKLIEEYGARVFDGVRAQEYGYVDVANSSYDSTLLALMQEANVDPSQPYQIVQLKPQHGFLSELMEGRTPKVEHQLQLGNEQKERFAFLYDG